MGSNPLLPHKLKTGVNMAFCNDAEFDNRPSGQAPTILMPPVGARPDGRFLKYVLTSDACRTAMGRTAVFSLDDADLIIVERKLRFDLTY